MVTGTRGEKELSQHVLVVPTMLYLLRSAPHRVDTGVYHSDLPLGQRLSLHP